ncbi:MAG: hypothetical protein U9Q70_03545 [Chloroflexota bacterium]|nr:hypothetical protein [Chloroflexota bacterium]
MFKLHQSQILTISWLLILIGGDFLLLGRQQEPTQATAGSSADLLINGNFETGAFQWFYPNHYVAANWNRWWIHGTPAPEFTDIGYGRLPYEGDHAQVYHSWNAYTAGIFQQITGLTPCRPYELRFYAKTNSPGNTTPNTKIGLDPTGSLLTTDGAVKNGLPAETVWSAEQTALYTWEELAVQAEPVGASLTAILYSAPRSSEYVPYDTFWDAGELVPVSYHDGRLPAPSAEATGFINNTNIVTGSQSITITWQTDAGASTQVWYNILTPSPQISPTTTLTHTAYLPLIATGERDYEYSSGINYIQATIHQVIIDALQPDDEVRFIILARHFAGACLTERSEQFTARTKAMP